MSQETSLNNLELTFYGHFSGGSSYPVVCMEIARWMFSHGVDLRLVNLRKQQMPPDLQRLQDPMDGTRTRIGLLFGFPSWYAEIPHHEVMIGYHVGDVTPLPPEWIESMRSNCSMILTPSEWCRGLITDDGKVSLGEIPIHIVPHGVSEEMVPRTYSVPAVCPTIRMKHFSSSVSNSRKGTIDLLHSAQRVLEGETVHKTSLCVSVHPQAFAEAVHYVRDFEHGSIRVDVDSAKSRTSMASSIKGADIIVQPSRAEGFGLIPLEAAACGIPSIMTACTGHGQYIDDLLGAVVIAPDGDMGPCTGGRAPSVDPDGLDAALRYAIDHVDELKVAALQKSVEVRKKWSWSSVLDRHLLPLLKSLCS